MKWQEFTREFIRVNFDKAVLVAAVLFFWKLGDREMMKAAMMGLAVSINHNRFQRS